VNIIMLRKNSIELTTIPALKVLFLEELLAVVLVLLLPEVMDVTGQSLLAS
jgi:hypothetical protein